MRKRLSLLTAVLLLSCFCTTQARERSDAEMRAIAAGQLRGTSSLARSTDGLPLLKKVATTETYQIFAPQEGCGFVVVSSDDTHLPVLGYSAGTYDETNLPSGLRWWLAAIDTSLREGVRRAAATRSADYAPVENFVFSHWGQGKPYNALTPAQGSKQCVTGCVATAMAQILNHYQYPATSTGTGSYTIDGKSATNVSLSTTYQWDGILDEYDTRVTYSEEDSRPVAELVRDCGLAAHMDYTSASSGALMSEAALGLSRNFSFEEAYTGYLIREFYSDAEWMDIIYTELTAHRPILYGGIDEGTGGGHAFVFSGFDEEGRIYVNWGWDGTADGYFDIADLGPKGVLGRSLNHFNSAHDMILGITPNPETSGLRPKYSEMCFPDGYSLTPSAASNRLSVRAGAFYNMYYKTFRGVIDLLMEADDGTVYSFNFHTEEKGAAYRYGYSSKNKLVNLETLPVGTYKAYLASKSEKDTYYQPARCEGGAICYQVTKADDGTFVVGTDPVSLYGATTGIKPVIMSTGIDAQAANGKVYDLNGRQVGHSTDTLRKGLYIIDGRKVVKY